MFIEVQLSESGVYITLYNSDNDNKLPNMGPKLLVYFFPFRRGIGGMLSFSLFLSLSLSYEHFVVIWCSRTQTYLS